MPPPFVTTRRRPRRAANHLIVETNAFDFAAAEAAEQRFPRHRPLVHHRPTAHEGALNRLSAMTSSLTLVVSQVVV